ncbi:MAG: hypothetical protein OXC65_08875 [Thiotrichales bacterium]|nr:hypothetical protein [Thiotrichales bacterium]
MKLAGITLAAAVVATVMAEPVAAQTTTGTITGTVEDGFTIPMTVTLNGNREWEITYSADFATNIVDQVRVCGIDTVNVPDSTKCPINPPYIMRYGVLSQAACTSQPPQSAIRGVNGMIPLDAWTQTLRTKPETSYCIAMYPGNSDHPYFNVPFAVAAFTTPADPSPPSTPWAPTPGSSGCFAETSPSLVQSCLNCKYVQTDRRWDGNANQCVSASS